METKRTVAARCVDAIATSAPVGFIVVVFKPFIGAVANVVLTVAVQIATSHC